MNGFNDFSDIFFWEGLDFLLQGGFGKCGDEENVSFGGTVVVEVKVFPVGDLGVDCLSDFEVEVCHLFGVEFGEEFGEM